MKKVMIVFGTRLEGIVTGQHREMLGQVLRIFEVVPDYDLNIMKQGQDLYDVTARVLTGMRDVLKEVKLCRQRLLRGLIVHNC